MKKINPGWGIALFGSLALVAAIFSPILLPERAASWVMSAFEPVCHQLPHRSPHIGGTQLAVCHRCLGIYSAIPIAVVLFLFSKTVDPLIQTKAKFYFALSLVPIALDWGFNLSPVWHNTPASRLVTGSIFGLCAGYFLAVGLYKLFDEKSPDDPEAGSAEAVNFQYHLTPPSNRSSADHNAE